MKGLISLILVIVIGSPTMAFGEEISEMTPDEQCRSQLRLDPFEARGSILAIYLRCILHHKQLEQRKMEGALKAQKRSSLQTKGITSFPKRGAIGQQSREHQRQLQLRQDRRFQRVYFQDLRISNQLRQSSNRSPRNISRKVSKTEEYFQGDYQTAARVCSSLSGIRQNICIRKELRGGAELKTFQK